MRAARISGNWQFSFGVVVTCAAALAVVFGACSSGFTSGKDAAAGAGGSTPVRQGGSGGGGGAGGAAGTGAGGGPTDASVVDASDECSRDTDFDGFNDC